MRLNSWKLSFHVGRHIRIARKEDLSAIQLVLDAAREIMRSIGNTNQWINGYPSDEVILSDIEKEYGHVVVDEDSIVGYFAYIPSPEPTYARIYEGTWQDDDSPYHVIHRIASLPEAHSIFKAIMDWCFQHERHIRIDTHRDNSIMRHCIESYGFQYCGIIHLASGDERMAYQLFRVDS